jgi:hypothetical protein
VYLLDLDFLAGRQVLRGLYFLGFRQGLRALGFLGFLGFRQGLQGPDLLAVQEYLAPR